METLATLEQFAEYRGVDHDPTDMRALTTLESVSGYMRTFTNQTLTKVVDDRVQLRGNWTTQLYLPQRPVDESSIHDVVVRFGNSIVEFPVPLFTKRRDGLLTWPGGYWGGEDGWVKATYTHGYDVVPDELWTTCCSIAARTYSNPTQAVAESIGTYSVRHEARGLLTQFGIAGDELQVLNSYKMELYT